jgi:alpha-galactosidase
VTGVWPDQASGAWLLELRSTCYALGLADDGTAAPPLRPVLYNSWEAAGLAVSHVGQAERAAELGVECFVVHDGWFAGRDHDHAGLGDWTPDRAKSPAGLTPLIERVSGT